MGEVLRPFWSSVDLTGNQTMDALLHRPFPFWSSVDLTGNQTARLDQAVTSTVYSPKTSDEVARYQAKKLTKGNFEGFARACGEYARNDSLRSLNETIMANAKRDRKKGVRFARVPTGRETCTFCLMLAGRGAVYHTRQTAGEFKHFHRRCDCKVVPGFEDDPDAELVEGYKPKELRDTWKRFEEIDGSEGLNQLEKDAAKRSLLGLPGPQIVYRKPEEAFKNETGGNMILLRIRCSRPQGMKLLSVKKLLQRDARTLI